MIHKNFEGVTLLLVFCPFLENCLHSLIFNHSPCSNCAVIASTPKFSLKRLVSKHDGIELRFKRRAFLGGSVPFEIASATQTLPPKLFVSVLLSMLHNSVKLFIACAFRNRFLLEMWTFNHLNIPTVDFPSRR